MRVLICGYSPRTHSSYGTIIYELWSRLIKTGEFQVEQHAWFNIPSLDRDVKVPWKLHPTKIGITRSGKKGFIEEDRWGEQSFEDVLRQFKPDIVWCLSDIYMSKYIDDYKQKYKFKLIRWTLTEGEPVDRTNIPYVELADKTVAITQYAYSRWKEITGEDYSVVYHGVDHEIFRPVSSEEKKRLRQEVTSGEVGPDDFLMTFVGRNQARKRPWLPFEILHYLKTGAWGYTDNGQIARLPWDPVFRTHKDMHQIREFADDKPNVKLWVHSVDDGTRWIYPKLESEWDVGDEVIKTVGYTDKSGLPTDEVAKLYQMSDCLLMLSGSEGFGVPIIEAAACGVPCVYTDYSGHGEIGRVCKGKPVQYDGWEPAPVTHVRWVYPNVNEAISQVYSLINESPNVTQKRAELMRSIICEQFTQDIVAQRWLEILRDVHESPSVETIGVRL